MIQAKQRAGVTFVLKEPQKATIQIPPKIVWEVPPPDFEIPDDPMDNSDQSLLAEALREALSLAKLTAKNQFCATSLAVCAKVDGKTVTKAPDWFYVPYAHPTEKNRHSYTPYADGKLPTIVMEFLSDNEGKEYDNSSVYPYGKWYYYETILKVAWYVIFDSDDGDLEVYCLEDGCYQKQIADKKGQYWIDSLELYLGVWKGLHEDFNRNTYWLCWWNAAGKRLLWQYEEKRDLLKKAKAENRKALKAEKQKALEKAKQAANNATYQIAKRMLQAQADVAFIQQVTGLNEDEILQIN